jgi:arylsulfatase
MLPRHRRILSLLAASLLLAWPVWPGLAAESRPNILLILADDLGYSDLGCYGGEIPTPNLDRLASGGIRCSAFYNSARCCPSRASLLTGLHPHQAGIASMTAPQPDTSKGPAYTGHLLPACATLAEMLGDTDYSTWMVGKWHLGNPGPVERGFQNYYGFRRFGSHSESQWDPQKYVRLPEGTAPELTYPKGQFYATDVFTDYALEFLNQARRQKAGGSGGAAARPWFLYLAHSAPHFPVQAPKATIDKYVATYRKGWDILRAERFERMKRLGLVRADAVLPPREMVPVDRADIANGYPGQPNPAWDSLPADRREDLARRMAVYAAMVEHVDRGIGRICQDLEKHGELARTLILFLSDNGACYEWGPFGFDDESRKGLTALHTGAELDRIGQVESYQSYGSGWANLCNTPLRLYKHFCHEGGISSPLIVHWPAGFPGRDDWVRDPAHIMDIAPTVLEAAGVSYPADRKGQAITPVEGRSLAPAFAGATLSERAIAFEHQEARALRRGDWKIAWGKRMTNEPAWELYNLKTDRSEQHNLAREQPEQVAKLAEEWLAWARRVKVHPFHTSTNPAPSAPPGSTLHAPRSTPPTPRSPETRYSRVAADSPALQIPPGTRPLLDAWMRDTYVTLGPDGNYYLTGTTAARGRNFDELGPHCWDWNDGLYLWRSPDLKNWTALGLVWSLDTNATWQSAYATRQPQRHVTGFQLDAKRRAVWAPELHYIRSATNWFLVACMNDSAPQKGSFILRSQTGRPDGPYENIAGNATGPIFPNIDGSLFEDDDGAVWFVGHNHLFARMKPDMSGFATGLQPFAETPYQPEPYIEGAFVFKHAGRYHLVQAIWSFKLPDGSFTYAAGAEKRGGVRWSYDCVIAASDKLEGPYGPRYTAGVGMGHNNLFCDKTGSWWATHFGNPRSPREFQQPFVCRPSVIPMRWSGSEIQPGSGR